MSKKRKWLFGIIFVIVILAVAVFFIYSNLSKTENFTKTSLIRMNIPLGGELNTTIKITNFKDSAQDINFYLNNFENLAFISDLDFILQPGESRNLIISFYDGKGVPGIYVGKLIIESSFSKEEIPIILGIEDPNHAFAIIQSVVQKYDIIYPGEKLGIDIKVFDLINSNVQTIKSSYVIKNLDDEVMLNGNTDLIVGAGSKTEIINIPKEWNPGEYVFILTINYKETLSFSSYLFYISSPSKKSFLFNNFELSPSLIIFFVLLIVGIMIYFISARDSLLIQLKKQQEQEIKRNIKCLEYSRKNIEKTEKKPEKRKEKLRKLTKIKKHVLGKIREKQKEQKKQISHLRKKKTKKEVLQNKINNWKKEGYKMYEINKGVKKFNHKNISSQIRDWNRQGYDTSFLNK